jgi:hypothetical protein
MVFGLLVLWLVVFGFLVLGLVLVVLGLMVLLVEVMGLVVNGLVFLDHRHGGRKRLAPRRNPVRQAWDGLESSWRITRCSQDIGVVAVVADHTVGVVVVEGRLE